MMSSPAIFKTLIVCYLLIPITLAGQTKADSLSKIIANHPDDTAKISHYLSLHDELKSENPSSALEPLEKALYLSEILGFNKGKAQSLLAIGNLQYTKGNYDSALNVYIKTQHLAQKHQFRSLAVEALCGQGNVLNDLRRLNESDSIINVALDIALKDPIDSAMASLCFHSIGNNSFINNQFDRALAYYQKAILYNTNNDRRAASTYLNIGSIHYSFEEFEKAEAYYLKGLEKSQGAKVKDMTALLHGRLAMLYRRLMDFNEARRYNLLALSHFELINDKGNMSHIHSNLALIHKDLKDYDQALDEYNKCLSLLKDINLTLGICYTLNNMGEIYFEKKEFKKAIEFFTEAKEASNHAGVLIISSEASGFLSKIYEQLGDYKKAYTYQVEYKALTDSLSSQTNKSRMAELEEKYQNEQKQQEIELLSAENQIASLELQKQANLRNYLILGAFLLVLLIGLIYSRYQVKARANAKLKELDHLKTNFFTNISHEFRTPLTLILSPVQKLLQMKNDGETQQQLSIIHRNASHLVELTNQLLDLSKLEAGKLSLEISKGDLRDLLTTTAASFESLADAQQIQFEVEIDQAPTVAYYDRDKIHKILNNLLSNAFKFTPQQGSITLKTQVNNGIIHISITDSGPGINASDQELIFQRFQQSSTTDPNAAGTGVGLTLSKELAVLHKGDLELESSNAEGTKFTLHFPINKNHYPASTLVESLPEVQNDQQQVNAQDEIASEQLSGHEQIILIVEDNADLRNHMTSLLKDLFTVKQATNGKEGITMAEEIVPDVIISDLMMPELDGIELCNALKENEKTSHVPIILLTAKADRETKLSGLKVGADDFLTKPFDNEELLVRVDNLISQRKKLQEKFAQKLTLSPSNIESESPSEQFIRKALEIVDQHLSNSAFTVEQFQEEMAMSRMQLHRKLKALIGFSASEFIRDIRLQRAADLLGQNGISVSEVAYSCGFNSTSYFTQCFKEKYGKSPSQYLKKAS